MAQPLQLSDISSILKWSKFGSTRDKIIPQLKIQISWHTYSMNSLSHRETIMRSDSLNCVHVPLANFIINLKQFSV